MPARSSWKGYLTISLVSVPVNAYTSTSSGGGQIRLNRLHEECHSRIQYKEVPAIAAERPNIVLILADDLGFGDPEVLQTGVEDPHAPH